MIRVGRTNNLGIGDHGIVDASNVKTIAVSIGPQLGLKDTCSHWYCDCQLGMVAYVRETTYEFSHSAFADGGLIPAIDLGDVVALDRCDVLVHGQVTGWFAGQYIAAPNGCH